MIPVELSLKQTLTVSTYNTYLKQAANVVFTTNICEQILLISMNFFAQECILITARNLTLHQDNILLVLVIFFFTTCLVDIV